MMLQKIAPKLQDYETELTELRLKEDALFAQALSSPQDGMLSQFQEIWATRESIHKAIEMNTTPMPTEPVEVTESAHCTAHCTIEEIRDLPKLYWYQAELRGKNDWIPKASTMLCKKGEKLPESIIRYYKLTPRQIAIFQRDITLEKLEGNEEEGNEDEPLWYDALPSARDSGDYAYTARDIILGRY